MADLVFYYGPMGCSKTANALMLRHNEVVNNGRHVWLIKPAVDTRDDKCTAGGKKVPIIKSRVGISAEAYTLKKTEHICPPCPTDIIICDEAQFLQPWQVDELNEWAKDCGVKVFCFGLKTDFRTQMFPGSKRLFELADRLVELETFCECGNKATLTAKFLDGKLTTTGNQIDIGGDEKYKAMCYRCWNYSRRLQDDQDY